MISKRFSDIVSCSCIALALSSFADESAESVVVGGDDRPVSKFKIGDEWLALPEVFSNLDFAGITIIDIHF